MNDFKEEDLEKSLSDLPWFLSECAIDLDNYHLDRSKDISSIKKLTEILNVHQLPGDTLSLSGPFPYLSLAQSILKSGEYTKKAYVSQLALEMGLLKLELKNISYSTPERLSELSLFLCDFSQELIRERRLLAYRLVA